MKKLTGFILLFFMSFLLMGCGGLISEILSDGPRSGEMIFGTGTFEQGIQHEKTVFSTHEDILMEANFAKPLGTRDVYYILHKIDGGHESYYDDWYDTLDPSWDWILTEFHLVHVHGVFDIGNYRLRLYNDYDELMAEGSFSIR
ncbi:hypothetical protein [Evansella cellulosilytica]|uniref:Lipoprotein n=1 Tax=Evansella cellulosilytica (strain ATCC 21833 / DSM 2522 / FERM P-1141 / JCM 9156 / N-4) TaxID=649639 RepID=E6TTY1_EVAC2|nr:hypothetical protein [Evansella cellulosilytica]ADU32012.1 hypothetical protein Bcell_3772 [Evansella cellulosilytica DSM 2522]